MGRKMDADGQCGKPGGKQGRGCGSGVAACSDFAPSRPGHRVLLTLMPPSYLPRDLFLQVVVLSVPNHPVFCCCRSPGSSTSLG